MIVRGVSLQEMFAQSVAVLTKPSVASFEEFERKGGIREAITYVGVAAAISAVAALLFGLLGGIGTAIVSALVAVLGVVVGYAIFSGLIYFAGKTFFGGTGTPDEVFYSTALYMAPIQAVTGVISAIPLLGFCLLPATLVLGLYSLYLGYLAARSSMNLSQNNAIFTAIIAVVGNILISSLVMAPIAALFLSQR